MENLSIRERKGFLVSFEGPDGSGKSSLLKMLYEELVKDETVENLVCIQEPGGTDLGLVIRKILFDMKIGTHSLEPNAGSLLYLISHIQNVHEIIIPALKTNSTILCDRYDYFSGVAYAHDNLDTLITELRTKFIGPFPDLVFYLRGNVEEFRLRATHQESKKWNNSEFLIRAQNKYDEMFCKTHNFGVNNVITINADNLSLHEIFTEYILPNYQLLRKSK